MPIDEYLNRMEQLLGRVDTRGEGQDELLGNLRDEVGLLRAESESIRMLLRSAHEKLERILAQDPTPDPDPPPQPDYDIVLAPGANIAAAMAENKRIGLRPGVYPGGIYAGDWRPGVLLEGIEGEVVIKPTSPNALGLQFGGANCRDITLRNLIVDCIFLPHQPNNTAIKATKSNNSPADNIVLENVSVQNLLTPRSVALLVDSGATLVARGGALVADAYAIYCASDHCSFENIVCHTNHMAGDSKPYWGIHLHREDGSPMESISVRDCDCWSSQGIMVWQGGKLGGEIIGNKARLITIGSNSKDWVVSKNRVNKITTATVINKLILSTTPGVLDDNTYV